MVGTGGAFVLFGLGKACDESSIFVIPLLVNKTPLKRIGCIDG